MVVAVSGIIEFQVHAIMDLVVLKCDVVLVDVVPLLQHNLLSTCPSLRGNELLEVLEHHSSKYSSKHHGATIFNKQHST